MSRADAPRPCPSAEELGAYLEGTLDPRRREEIGRHIISCDACLLVIRETTRYSREHDHTSAKFWAVAAGIVVAIVGAALFWFARREDPVKELAATAQASGVRRIEGRLAGFAYAPYRAPRSPDSVGDPAVAAAATGVLSDTKPKSAEEWHAVGIADVLLGRDEDAARALAQAAQLAPRSAEYRSDLSAARIALAAAREDSAELQRALADAMLALQLDRHFLAAQFNRAVALDRLGRTSEAIHAYGEYLAADRQSPWSAEARWRLDRLRR